MFAATFGTKSLISKLAFRQNTFRSIFMKNKVATKALKMPIGSTNMLSMNRTSLLSCSRYNFCTKDGIAKIEKSLKSLNKTLSDEIKFEKENYEPLKEIEEFLEYSGFKLAESPDSNQITLKKKVGNVFVKVIFESSAPETEDQSETEVPAQYEKYQEMLDEGLHDFTVAVTKSEDGADGVIAEFVARGGESIMCFIGFTHNIKELLSHTRLTRSNYFYSGPDYHSLDPSLKKPLNDYFNELGINSELANFIDAVSIDKDQKLYLRWLEESKDFLGN